jgi:glutamate-5-semialdehyde dehydrogenase
MDRAQIEATVLEMVKKAKAASRKIGAMPTALKNTILLEVGEALLAQQQSIIAENGKDMAAGEAKGLSSALLHRLQLAGQGIRVMVQGVREVAALEDRWVRSARCAVGPAASPSAGCGFPWA